MLTTVAEYEGTWRRRSDRTRCCRHATPDVVVDAVVVVSPTPPGCDDRFEPEMRLYQQQYQHQRWRHRLPRRPADSACAAFRHRRNRRVPSRWITADRRKRVATARKNCALLFSPDRRGKISRQNDDDDDARTIHRHRRRPRWSVTSVGRSSSERGGPSRGKISPRLQPDAFCRYLSEEPMCRRCRYYSV